MMNMEQKVLLYKLVMLTLVKIELLFCNDPTRISEIRSNQTRSAFTNPS